AILARQSKSFLYTVLDLIGRAFKENSIRATASLSSPSWLANRRVFFILFLILFERAFKENSIRATASLARQSKSFLYTVLDFI
ncbi:hypothetical protein J7I90_23070, partial [Bacillus sp. ISL-57]|nr:hypothetical protein [Bacillus sp. ISL-57]